TENSNARSEWQLRTVNEARVFSQVVVANAWSAKALLPDYWLPTGKIRGQISYLNSDETELPKTVLCGRSYTAPALNKQRVIGATYNLKDDEENLRQEDHQENIEHSLDFGDELQNRQITGGRVSFRCTTPDYLPMVGALPDTRSFLTSYQSLARNAKRIPRDACPTASGLWLNVGHGSRGLASTPLCAELLASEISGDSSPIGLTVKEALWPGRFLMRDMIRKKISLEDLDD
ncbi:MAG: FAD-dependent 5-carboxymethylaminomethyl-2-thiouridine(34) oxidoreductase MnmC, partial [Oceanobacter sp.]